jgi:hypothetical protein
MASRKNHVVSAGYLRHFAIEDRVRYLELDGSIDRSVGVRDIFHEHDFSVVDLGAGPDDRVEREWERLESFALPRVRGLVLAMPLTDEDDAAVKVLVALHFARSYGVARAADVAWTQVVKQFKSNLESNTRVQEVFRRTHDRAPRPGELQAITQLLIDSNERSNVVQVNKQMEYYNRMLSLLRPLRTQIGLIDGGPHPPHFITSDSPLTLKDGGRVSAPGQGVGVGDANTFLMPLTRHAVASFTSSPAEPQYVYLDPMAVREINAHVSNAAMRFVVTSPRTDLSQSAPWLPSRPSQPSPTGSPQPRQGGPNQ